METLEDFESLEEEVKELLLHYKHKKATIYEPCTQFNFKDCLIGLHEELGLLNISYIFNPYLDVENDTLTTEALVKLINGFYTLLYKYKSIADKSEVLSERNHVLETTNKQLNEIIKHLKEKVNNEKNESRACVATAQRISNKSDAVLTALAESQAMVVKITKQKQSKEKAMSNEIARLKLENEKLQDKLRNKTGSFTPCAEVCDTTLTQLRDRERRQRAIITKLENNNRDLIKEVLALKEELLLSGVAECIDNKYKK